ncbi:protein TIFY 10B-like [Syzygium oleosum]|uniref:protein TIFY 10B-like n=1 Tax=Syzygium oleosum TaxID=219896 RepID=UPI0024BA5B98|nr:protein TIFY 10B-like [Syzygium oleosum]
MQPQSTLPGTEEFMKIDSPDTVLQRSSNLPLEKPNSDEDGWDHDDIKTELKLTNGASHGDYLFRTSMATKAPTRNITTAKTDVGGPGSSRQPLLPPQFGCYGPWLATCLERGMFPQMRNTQFSDCKSEKSQLTIFYAGTVNVYNNVPVDKAQAIMLLAGESSLTKPVVAKSGDIIKTIPPQPRQISLPSICKPQGDIPMARKNSLCLFLQKRHDRITNKSPYCSSGRKHREVEPREEEGSRNTGNDRHCSPLSPFPSRLGFLCSVSTTKK